MVRQMSQLVLFCAAGSAPARSVMMLGDLIGLRLDCRDVNLIRFEHKTEAYKKINPMGTVPVLKDGDFILSESHAILRYLLGSYGGPDHKDQLYPKDLKTRALVDQCMFYNAGYLFPRAAAVAVPTLLYGLAEPSQKQLEAIDEAYGVIEAYLQHRRFLAADHFTLADLSVGATATASQVILELDRYRYPRFVEWMKELEEMSCFRNINSEGVLFLRNALNKMWQRNKLKLQQRV